MLMVGTDGTAIVGTDAAPTKMAPRIAEDKYLFMFGTCSLFLGRDTKTTRGTHNSGAKKKQKNISHVYVLQLSFVKRVAEIAGLRQNTLLLSSQLELTKPSSVVEIRIFRERIPHETSRAHHRRLFATHWHRPVTNDSSQARHGHERHGT